MKISSKKVPSNTWITTFALESLGNRAYIVENSKKALLIDPPLASWAIEKYLHRENLQVVGIFDTHIHNDFVSGSPGLAEKYSVPNFAPTHNDRRVEGAESVWEGQQLDFEGFGIIPVHTPGHTLDHHAFVLSTESASKAAIFSGGSWLQGSLGRVDLDQDASPEELARLQLISLEKMMSVVEDETLLMPTHGFGSYCSYGSVTVEGDTVADDKKRNPYIMKDGAEKRLLSNPLPVPPHFRKMASINIQADRRSNIEDFGSYLSTRISLDPDSAVDARTRESRLESGLLGSKVLGTDGPFPVWFGWREMLIGSDSFVVDSPEAAELLTEGLVSTGEPAPERFILPGLHLTQHLSPVTYRQQEASNLDLSQIENHVLIDLRHRGEWLLGHLRGSRNLPFEDFNELPEELLDNDVAVYCGSGYRASMFLALAKKSNQDRVSINGSMLKTFCEGEYWCSIPHNGAHCNT